MLIDKSTSIEDLRFYRIIENWAFNIYHDRNIMTVEDLLNSEDNAFPEIKDYIVRSLKAFLKQVIESTEPDKEGTFKNPQVEDAYQQTINEGWAVEAVANGTAIFKNVVDVISFLQIGTDDDYNSWLKTHGIEMSAEMSSLETTFQILKGIRNKLFMVNKFNLYIRFFDYVLSISRFRDVERRSRANTFRQNKFTPNRGRAANRFGNGRPMDNNRQPRWNDRYADNTDENRDTGTVSQPQVNASQDAAATKNFSKDIPANAGPGQSGGNGWGSPLNEQSGMDNGRFNDTRNPFVNRNPNNGRSNGNDRYFNNNRPFSNGRNFGNNGFTNGRYPEDSFTKFNRHRNEGADNDFWNQSNKMGQVDAPAFNEGGIVESDGTWNPRMINRVVNFLKKSNSPDLIRLTSVSGINDENAEDDERIYTEERWAELESRRRYLDSVNRGLGLPNNDQLIDLLKSSQWKTYDFYQLNFITRNNLNAEKLLAKEQISLKFGSLLFFIALVKGMAIVNLKVDVPGEEKRTDIYSCLVPDKFAGFSYTSFLAVIKNRLQSNGAENTSDQLTDLFEHSLGNRYWKNGATLASQDCELFLSVIRGIAADVLGLDLTVDGQAFKEKIEREELLNLAKVSAARKSSVNHADGTVKKGKGGRPAGSKTKGVINIGDAIKKVIEDRGLPMTREDLVAAVIQLKPGTKESSISTIMATCHAKKELEYFDGGLVGITGVDYGSGYIKITRMPKRSSSLS